MGLDLNTALISDTFDGLIKTTDGNVLTSSPLVITDGRGNDSSLALATAGNGVAITGTLTVNGSDISGGLATAQADITAIEAKTDFITVTGAVNLDTINTKVGFITVTQAVDLDTIESDIAVATAKTQYITVTQAVDLDTMESDILSAKTKTDYITISQAVNLDTVESGLATAQSDITAIEAKTDYITISSALNLNTVASNASAAKTKTDFLTVTQPVNLDTLESDVNVAKGDITAIEAKTDNITVTQAVNLDTMESDIADAKTKTDFITITQAVNLDTVESGLAQAQTDINLIEAKTNNITVTQAVNLDTMESDIATNNAKNSYPAGDATKVGFISVTQAVDLDSMETDISNLSSNKYDKTGGTISGSVVVTGDLTVNGTTTTVNTQTLSVEDPLIELANQNAANTVDTGFYANYSLDAGVTTKYAGLFKDASDSDKFKLFKGLEVEPTSSVDTAGTGYAKGDLVIGDLNADSGSISGTLSATTLNGTLSTAAQPNITSVGTLSSLAVSGNLTVDTDTLYVNASNNRVGVGTSSPAEDLHISATNAALRIDNDGAEELTIISGFSTFGNYIQSYNRSGGAYEKITHRATEYIWNGGGGQEFVRIDTSGRVGIGTSSPDRELHVYGKIAASNSDDSGAILLEPSNTLNTIFSRAGNLFGTPVPFAIKMGSTEALRIDNSGNVGIGTSNPSSYNAQLVSFKDGGSFAYLGHNNSGGTFPKVSALSFGSNAVSFSHSTNGGTNALQGAAQIAAIQAASTDAVTDMAFYTTTGGSVSEKLRITSAGNVGIGTSSPSTKLYVYAANTPAKFESSTTTLYNAYKNSNGNFGFIGTGSGVASGGSADDFGIQAVNNFVFATGGSTEKMRITSGGDLLFSTGLNFATQRVDSKVISSGSPQTIFDLSSENNGIYIVSVVRVSGSTGTRWIGFVAVSLGNCFIQTILDSSGLTASTSGGDFQVQPAAGITVSATVRPMSID